VGWIEKFDVLVINEHVILKNHNMIICHKTKAVANYRTQFRFALSVELLLAQNKRIYCQNRSVPRSKQPISGRKRNQFSSGNTQT
jgi:hypothetical protein